MDYLCAACLVKTDAFGQSVAATHDYSRIQFELPQAREYEAPVLNEEETLRQAAMFRAMERLFIEKPPQSVETRFGLKIDSTIMDGPYLERLMELADEEYQKAKDVTIQ